MLVIGLFDISHSSLYKDLKSSSEGSDTEIRMSPYYAKERFIGRSNRMILNNNTSVSVISNNLTVEFSFDREFSLDQKQNTEKFITLTRDFTLAPSQQIFRLGLYHVNESEAADNNNIYDRNLVGNW